MSAWGGAAPAVSSIINAFGGDTNPSALGPRFKKLDAVGQFVDMLSTLDPQGYVTQDNRDMLKKDPQHFNPYNYFPPDRVEALKVMAAKDNPRLVAKFDTLMDKYGFRPPNQEGTILSPQTTMTISPPDETLLRKKGK